MFLGQDDSGGEVFGPPASLAAPAPPSTDLLSPGGGFWSEVGSAVTSVAKAVTPILPAVAKVYLQQQAIKSGKPAGAIAPTLFPAGGTPGLAPTAMMPAGRGYSGAPAGGIPTWAYLVGGAVLLLGVGLMVSRR